MHRADSNPRHDGRIRTGPRRHGLSSRAASERAMAAARAERAQRVVEDAPDGAARRAQCRAQPLPHGGPAERALAPPVQPADRQADAPLPLGVSYTFCCGYSS